MVITWDGILTAGAVLTASGTVIGLAAKVIKWIKKTTENAEDIRHIKKENALLCYAMSACLDGLMQLGANHTVPLAKDKLDKHLNLQAHE